MGRASILVLEQEIITFIVDTYLKQCSSISDYVSLLTKWNLRGVSLGYDGVRLLTPELLGDKAHYVLKHLYRSDFDVTLSVSAQTFEVTEEDYNPHNGDRCVRCICTLPASFLELCKESLDNQIAKSIMDLVALEEQKREADEQRRAATEKFLNATKHYLENKQ